MTAPVGSRAFTTEESKEAEDRHTSLIKEVFQAVPMLEIKKEVSIQWLTSGNNSYSLRKDKESQVWRADGGYIYYKGVLVGLAECKYQWSRQNACERAAKYLLIDELYAEPWRLFISCYGPGFVLEDGGGSTGPLLDMMKHRGVTILENPTDEEFLRELQSYLSRIKAASYQLKAA